MLVLRLPRLLLRTVSYRPTKRGVWLNQVRWPRVRWTRVGQTQVGRTRLGRTRVRQARRAVIAFFAITLLANAGLSMAMETIWPILRDTEYIKHRERFAARVQAFPHKKVHAVIGSSRAFHGVRPLVIPSDGPVLGNMSLIGAGPCLQLLTLQRLLRDRIPPQAIILEYWPPFLHGEGELNEFVRLDPHRYFLDDEPFIRAYHPDAEGVLRLMRSIRRLPIWEHRQRLMSYLLPSWLPHYRRLDYAWDKLDAAGWMPGASQLDARERQRRLGIAADYYKPLFARYALDATAVRAMRDLLATCRQHGIEVTLVWLPESSEFRSWYTAAAEQAGTAFFAELSREGGVRAINARDWIPDDLFADGYHLTTQGATAFTLQLAEQLQSLQ